MVKFSFIIPAYNRKNHIINTLMALNYQDGYVQTDYEVIVVDDGSEENLIDSIQGINTNYDLKYFYLDRCDDSCLARARNFGWKNCEGQIIIFIDSDIIVKRNYLQEVERYYQMEKDLLLIGTRLMLQEEVAPESIKSGAVFNQCKFNDSNFEILENRHYLFNQYSYNASAIRDPWLKVYGCNFIIPRAWLEKIGGFDENFKGWGEEDIDIAYRSYIEGIKTFVNSKLEVLHQFHGGSDLIGEDKFEAYERNINYLYDKHPNALDFPRDFIIEFSKGKVFIDLSVDKEKPITQRVIDFMNRDELPELKQLITRLSNEKWLDIIVNDYIEDTDLDIWIQLLGPKNSTPKYFPASKKINTGGMKYAQPIQI